MTRLYVLGYRPGACGDFLAGRIWTEGNHWYKEVPEYDQPKTIGITSHNRYWYHSPLHYVGIADKRFVSTTTITDDTYTDIPAGSTLSSLSEDQVNLVWDKISTSFGDKPILTNTHFSRNEYPWDNDRVYYVGVDTTGSASDITDAMCVVKSTHVSIFDESAFVKLPIDHPNILKYSKTFTVHASREFRNRAWATKWEAGEIQTHQYPTNHPKQLPNPEHWLKMKLLLGKTFKKMNATEYISLSAIYEKDKSELDKMFNLFGVEEYDPKIVWDYIDENLRIYESINKNGD